MCIRFNRLILLIITFLSASMFVEARDLSPYKKTCKEIGFKAGTEKFGKCVVKLIKRDKANNKTLEADRSREREQQEADRRYRQEQQEKAAANRRAQQREIELAKQRLEIEKRRVAIEEERAHRDKWNNISKGLQSLSDSLYGNQNQKNDDYQKQLCINSCRTQGDNYSYCQRVCR